MSCSKLIDNDILHEILDTNEIIDLCNNYKNNLPKFTHAYYFLLLHIKWEKLMKSSASEYDLKDIAPICKNHLYKYGLGNSKNSTFFSIAEDEQTIYFCTMENDCTELKKCLEETKLIKWEMKPVFQSISICHQHIKILKNLITQRNLEIEWEIEHIGAVLDKEIALAFEYEIPNDLYLDSLKPNDSHLIDSLWHHSFPGSENFIRSLIILNGGYGLYRKNTNELICWAVLNDLYSIGFLQTIETERRKGYGTLLTKIFSKKFSENEHLPVVTTIGTNNLNSRKLFRRLHYEQFDECSWIGMK